MIAKEGAVNDADYIEAAELFKKLTKLEKQREVQRRYEKERDKRKKNEKRISPSSRPKTVNYTGRSLRGRSNN